MRIHSESVLLRFLYLGVLFHTLEETKGGRKCNISSLSVVNFHIVGLLEICLSECKCIAIIVLCYALLFMGESFKAQKASHLFGFGS